MRSRIALLVVLSLSACSHSRKREHEESDRNSAAFKVGEAAHEVAKHAEKTAETAERELKESARKAAEGWKQKEKEDRDQQGR